MMLNYQLVLILVFSTIIMGALMAMQARWYALPLWKSVPIAVALVFTGVVGSQIWFFVENGYFTGRSLYGAIVFSPIVFFPLSKLLKIPYGKALDFVAPGGCLSLALVKLQCMRDNCCEGRILYLNEDHIYVRFPSQIVEMVAFLIISTILFYMASKPKFRGRIFPWFLVLYGGTRFFLDFLRETTPSYLFGLSAGSFWSLCSFIIGIISLVFVLINKKKREEILT